MKTPWRVGKVSTENELLVVSFTSLGAVLLLVELNPTPKILHLCRVNSDPSLTENEKRNGFLDFLASLKRKKYPRVALVWSDGMTHRQMSMPGMPSEDLEKAFAWELKKKYYYNPDENYFGFNEVMPVEGAEGPENLYNIFYCDKTSASSKLSFVQELGLEIRSLVPGQAALASFVGQTVPTPEGDVLVCEMDGTVVRILVVRENKNMLVRQITLGSQELHFTDEVLGKVAEEIRKTIDFYEGQKYFRPVTKIVLTGAVEDAQRVNDFLSRQLQTKVLLPVIDPTLHSGLNEEDQNLLQSQSGLFAAALGAVFVDDESMNLVPDDIKTKNRQRRMHRWLNLALLGVGGIFFLIFVGTAANTHFMKEQAKGLEKEYNHINEKKKVFEAVLTDEKVRRLVYKGSVYSPSLLKELSLRTPAIIALDEMQYSRADGTVILRGQVNDAKRESLKSVTQYATTLSESQFFLSATVSNSSRDEENKVLIFEITCVLRGLL